MFEDDEIYLLGDIEPSDSVVQLKLSHVANCLHL